MSIQLRERGGLILRDQNDPATTLGPKTGQEHTRDLWRQASWSTGDGDAVVRATAKRLEFKFEVQRARAS